MTQTHRPRRPVTIAPETPEAYALAAFVRGVLRERGEARARVAARLCADHPGQDLRGQRCTP